MCSLRRRAKSSIGLAGCSMSPFSFFSSSSRNARFVKLRRSYLAAQRLRGYTRKSERASKQVTGAAGKIAFPAGKPKSPGGHILKHSQKVWSRSFACWLALLCLWLLSRRVAEAKQSKAEQSKASVRIARGAMPCAEVGQSRTKLLWYVDVAGGSQWQQPGCI